MRRLLLVSTSTTFGTGYLDHCAEHVVSHFDGCAELLFVPYALDDRDGYARTAIERFEAMGFSMNSIHRSDDPVEAVRRCDGVFIGGGNTFRLLNEVQRLGLVQPLRERVAAGMPYMGTSAGSNLACPTLKTTNDMPIVQPASFEALDLVPFQINPHYLDPAPDSQHMGETRETRLREFHEENDTPVIGLREGAWLLVEGDRMTLRGDRGARIFERGAEPREEPGGADLSRLL